MVESRRPTFGNHEKIIYNEGKATIPHDYTINIRHGPYTGIAKVLTHTLTGIEAGKFKGLEPLFTPESPHSVQLVQHPEIEFVIHIGVKFTIPGLKKEAKIVYTNKGQDTLF